MPNSSSERLVNQNNAFRQDGGVYSDVIKGITERGECPFCRENLRKTHSKPIYAEGQYWLATENAYPYENTSQHLLFIAKSHIETIEELTPQGWEELRQLIADARIERKIPGAALLMRFGRTAFNGASVVHLHAQLIAGTGDTDAAPVLARVG
jgi:diadenosine tetraphosphate (Ap4A) HIT family hydrolase